MRRALPSPFVTLALVLAVSGNAAALPGSASAKPDKRSTADHSKFKVLQQDFKSGQEVTRACLSCHTEAARHIMKTRHWTWEYTHPDTGQKLGKKTMLNGFCIGDQSNEAFCNSCHIGYGWENDEFDFANEENVDCLVCHNQGQYTKPSGLAGHPAYVRTEYPPGSGTFLEPVNLAQVAAHVGPTRKENCGACHYNGGGGDGVKHGDLDSSLNRASRQLDVHMSADGGNFSCSTCHQTDAHQVSGSRIAPTAADPHGPLLRGQASDRNPTTCQSCHGDAPHRAPAGRLSVTQLQAPELLNAHTRTLACQTCHIPTFARGGIPTKMSWDWSQAGKMGPDGKPQKLKDEHGHIIYDSRKGQFGLGENVTPEYLWFNGKVTYTLQTDTIDPSRPVPINTFHGTPGAPDARIWPVKRFRGRQPYDTKNLTLLVPHSAIPDATAYWYNFDWDKALRAGAAATGMPFSGQYDFVDTEMLWPITHMVAPKEDALDCHECHRQDGRLAGITGVYIPGRDRHAWLDNIGWTLVGLTTLGSFGHGLARILTRRRKAQDSDAGTPDDSHGAQT
ncbi:MAG: tetrathionate reductase family octaheme c-type cytochrome [Azovibrio sp.]|nr:tetrathionate reductase family octaheme c-type cytochrome [Azovibrio sp.]